MQSIKLGQHQISNKMELLLKGKEFQIVLPVSVSVLRFAIVSITAYLALHFSLTIDIIFYAVSVGLTITGVGLALCLFGPDWKSSN